MHWLAAVGAALALVGSLYLWRDLKTTKEDDARAGKFRAAQDDIESLTRESVIGLTAALSRLAGLFARYVKILELDLEPLFEPLLEKPDADALRLSVAARSRVSEGLTEAQTNLSASMSPEAIERIRDIRRRAENLYSEERAKAQRMQRVARTGVTLVALGTIAQLVDALLG